MILFFRSAAAQTGAAMNKKLKKIAGGCILWFTGFTLAGCFSPGGERIVNEMVFDLNNISDLEIAYDEENITFCDGRSEKLVIREYMTDDNRRYYANTEIQGKRLHISEGGRPLFKDGFSCRVEVFLPASYNRDLSVITTSGVIDMTQADLMLDSLRAETTSGEIRLEQVKAACLELETTRGILDLGTLLADQITIHSTEGRVNISRMEGNVNYTSTHGSLMVDAAVGAGIYQTSNDGLLQLRYEKADGDLQFYNKNGDILLTLPSSLAFELEAVSRNGSVSADFGKDEKEEKGWVKGKNGSAPYVKISLESRNGKLEIKKE